jgi:hypothetical protein
MNLEYAEMEMVGSRLRNRSVNMSFRSMLSYLSSFSSLRIADLKPFTVRWYTECVVLSMCHNICLSPHLRSMFVEVFSVQNFTGYTYMVSDPSKVGQAYYVAEVFDAVARGVKALGR